MKKFRTILLLLSVSCIVFAQTTEETAYFNNIVRKAITTPLRKGAKHKVISFPDKGYCISCDMLKKMPVEGRMFEINDGKNIILQGIYSVKNGRSTVHGKYIYKYNGSPVSAYGTFLVSNGADGLILKPGKASDLSITEYSVDLRSGFYLDCLYILDKQGTNFRLRINSSLGRWYYSEFSAEIPATAVTAYGFDNMESLLLSDTLNVQIKMKDGVEFSGHAIGHQDESGAVKFTLLDGEKRYLLSDKTITVNKNPFAVNKYSFILKNRKDRDISEEILSLPAAMEHIDLDSLWSKSYYLRHSPEIIIKYANGDTYSGKFKLENNQPVITTGTYTYKNGDKFIGDLSGEYFGNVPIEGETIFNSGRKKKGNWLKEYPLSDSQLISLSKEEYVPSIIRNKAAALVNENNFNKLVEKAENCEARGDFEMAKSLYREALTHKNNTGISYRIESLDKKIKKQKLAQKYGNKYADNIMNGVIETGMTKEMCELVLSEAVGMDFYRISSWRNFVGDQMETWEFDYDYGIEKENQRRLREGIEDNDKNALLVYGFMNAIGNLTSEAASNMAEYKYLKFKNSVLIELKDSSFYDDVNKAQREAEDALNSLYWLFGE